MHIDISCNSIATFSVLYWYRAKWGYSPPPLCRSYGGGFTFRVWRIWKNVVEWR